MEQRDSTARHSLAALLLSVAKSLVILAVLAAGSYAWLNIQTHEIRTLSAVNMPSLLDIRGEDGHAITQIQLDDVQTVGDENRSQYLFSVMGDVTGSYRIELAHTTNMPFDYRLYEAQEGTPAGWLLCQAPNGSGYSYNSTQLPLDTLNPDNVLPTVGEHDDGTNYYKANTYDPTDSVQKNAMPLFEITRDPIRINIADIHPTVIDGTAQDVFLHYYVLEVTWDESLSLDRETDMVYIFVRTVRED